VNTWSVRSILIAVSAALLFILMVTPFLEPYGYFTHLDGTAGIMDHWNLWTSSNPIPGITYAIGDILCHQMQSRSFILNGSQMAVCARDFSILAGFFIGLLMAATLLRKRTIDKRMLYLSILLIMTAAVDWAAEHITGADILSVRVITGILAGIGLAVLVERYLARYDGRA